MKTNRRIPLLLAFVSALALPTALYAAEEEVIALESEKMSGRCQYESLPGNGAGSMRMVDASLPQAEVRVGPTEKEGVGLGYLIGFELNSDQINKLLMASKIELVLTILKTSLGGAPSPQTVALLSSASPADPASHPQFGAWNNAPQLLEVGKIDADPEIGEVRIDVTEALHNAPPPNSKAPLVYFGIYGATSDFVHANRGQHIHFGGKTDTAPRLVIHE